MTKTLYIGLDIDGTVISHCYPYMNGQDLGAIPWLKQAQENYPVVYLLNTMRADDNDTGVASLQLAIDWLEERGISPIGAGVHPTQREWTTSPSTKSNSGSSTPRTTKEPMTAHPSCGRCTGAARPTPDPSSVDGGDSRTARSRKFPCWTVPHDHLPRNRLAHPLPQRGGRGNLQGVLGIPRRRHALLHFQHLQGDEPRTCTRRQTTTL